MPQLLEVSHVSKRGTSLRFTIPKSLWKVLDINDDNFVIGFYEVDGKIVIQKME